jgi:hypothetical protein
LTGWHRGWKPDKYSIPRDNSRRDKGIPPTLEDFKPMLAEQLGLEIVATNLPVEMLVVEKVK